MPTDDLRAQRQSIGRARLPDGREVASMPGAFGVLVVVLTAEGPQLQASVMAPDDLDEAADVVRDVAVGVRRGEPDLAAFVQRCWERRRIRSTSREMRALLRDPENRG